MLASRQNDDTWPLANLDPENIKVKDVGPFFVVVGHCTTGTITRGKTTFTSMDEAKSYSEATKVGESDIPVPDEESAKRVATFPVS
jgi:hypothetical protein